MSVYENQKQEVELNSSEKNGNVATEATETPIPKIIVSVDSDNFYAKIKLTTPKENDEKLSEKDVMDSLRESGVVSGIKTKCISRLLKYPIYERNFKIAQGAEPVQGQNGKLVLHFDKDNNLVPQVLEDGSVDYKNMGFCNDVKEGDLLCEVVDAVKGKDGFDVLGKVIPSKAGNPVPPPNGSNTKLSEDGTKLYASCEGHVSLKDDKVSIKRVMIVDKVDKATGNILFSGDVTVNGDVNDGFTIRAGGSITVKGVVENAILVAGRDIIISKGIKGKDSVVSAGGNIRTGYIEMAKVTAKECIYVDAVLNADITCGETMQIVGRRGCLIGGICRVSKELKAKEIGNDVNIFTDIILITPKAEEKDRETVNAKIKECNDKLENLAGVLRVSSQSSMESVQKKEAMDQVVDSKRTLEAELRGLNARLDELNSNTEIEYTGRILLNGHMYPNVTLNLEGLKLRNTTTRPACTITRKEDDIVFGAYTG